MRKLFEQNPKDLYTDIVQPGKEITQPVTNVNQLSPEQQDEINKAYAQLTGKSNDSASKASVIFSDKKGKINFSISGTVLEPTRLTMVGKGKFSERYKKQLEGYLYTDGEINPDNLIPFIMLLEASEDCKKTIRVTYKQNKALLKPIVETLNVFFKEQQNVIAGMRNMFKGAMTVQQGKPND